MYCELFNLQEPPFQLTPDPQFLFASKQHSRAKAYMESTIWLADGFVVITGEIGCGKTTLIESFLEELPEDVVLAHVSQTQLSPVEFLHALLVELGFQSFRMKKVELLSILKDFLVQQYAKGKTVLLVVDEAQNLSRNVLEQIRLMSGIEAQKEKVLRIVLVGQPELSEKLDSPRLEQLTQRVRLRFHISALSKRESKQYIEHRLDVAGADGRKIFDDEALDLVFRYTGGVPRLVNILCDTAMLCASADEKSFVDRELVEGAVHELQWIPYAERMKERQRTLESTDQYSVSDMPLARMDILFRDQLVADFKLPAGRAIIGRTSDNDIQIRSKVISRHHAQLTTDLQQCVIEDLNSTNGLYLKAERVKRYQLNDGDMIRIGEHKMYYRDLRRSLLDPANTGEQPATPQEPEQQQKTKDATGKGASRGKTRGKKKKTKTGKQK